MLKEERDTTFLVDKRRQTKGNKKMEMTDKTFENFLQMDDGL